MTQLLYFYKWCLLVICVGVGVGSATVKENCNDAFSDKPFGENSASRVCVPTDRPEYISPVEPLNEEGIKCSSTYTLYIHDSDGPPSKLHSHVPLRLAFSVMVTVSPLVKDEPLTKISVAKQWEYTFM